jgi:hypothetical protein
MAARRRGCLGCLGYVFLGLGIAVATYAVIAPWSFHIGGRLTPHGWWGVGRLQDSAGAQYGLYLSLTPNFHRRASKIGNEAWPRSALRGRGWIRTAFGTKYPLNMSGDLYGAWLDTDGKVVHLGLAERTGATTRRSFRLWGTWHGPDLVLDDHKTMFMNFRPDGKLTPSGGYTSPVPEKYARVTLRWGSYSDFESICSNLQKPD